MSEMFERFARALAEIASNSFDPVPYDSNPEYWNDEARNLIVIMRDPTPEMLAAAWTVFNRYPHDKLTPGPAFKEALQAMIDAALAEKETK